MPAHSASKTRVNALMSRASTSYFVSVTKDVDGRDKPGHDVESLSIINDGWHKTNKAAQRIDAIAAPKMRPGFSIVPPCTMTAARLTPSPSISSRGRLQVLPSVLVSLRQLRATLW